MSALFETERLRIVPLNPATISATLENRAQLEELLGARVPEEWPLDDVMDFLPLLGDLLRANPEKVQWGGVMITKREPTVVGDVGFHGGGSFGRHSQGADCEVGYSVLKEFRRRGFATEGLRALLDWGFSELGLRRVVGRCEVTNAASQKVLERSGMRLLGVEPHPVYRELVVYEASSKDTRLLSKKQ